MFLFTLGFVVIGQLVPLELRARGFGPVSAVWVELATRLAGCGRQAAGVQEKREWHGVFGR
jgi:hypothetical protein